MTSRRELPIAPRPEDDELLSSWQGRVACRYDLVHDEISEWLGVRGSSRCTRFAERDFAPPAEAVQAWATACRLSESRVGSLALSVRSRSRGWYVWGEGRVPGALRRPVCPVCLDEDVAAGRDHHVRRSWALVEILICNRHARSLEEACRCCLGSVGFRFVSSGEAARLACVACSRMVGAAVHPRRHSGFGDILGALSASIARAIADQPAMAERIMQIARLLWTPPSPRTGRRTPFVADVVRELRLPSSVETWVDKAEPLATAPLGWRAVTLLGIAKLLDVDGPWQDQVRLPFTIEQMVAWTEEPRPPPRRKEMHAALSHNQLSRRSEAEYLALARSILASEEWRAAQSDDPRMQRRTLNALIDKALAGERRPSSGARVIG